MTTEHIPVQADPAAVDWVPVLRPALPSADRLLPYLRRIDANRIYSNFGPLTQELEARLAAKLGVEADAVQCAASGTSALTGAILATAGRATSDRPLAIVPGFTFVATALAAELSGYTVRCCDVDADSWQLDPEAVASLPELGRIGLVLPVAPFGMGVEQLKWRDFRDATGVPVVIDAAASFEHATRQAPALLGEIPVALSFHATKSFSTGEGGCVVVRNQPGIMRRLQQSLNFGFFESRECAHPSLNGKMSEYHAAVGHAELDGWGEKEAALLAVAAAYRRRSPPSDNQPGLICAPRTCSSYVLYAAATAEQATLLERTLELEGIDTRRWYQASVHRQQHFRSGEALPVSDDLAGRLLGLPVAPDLDERQVDRVMTALTGAGA